jgi:TRAP-type mannitol/chloroaromatic compound transport system substrate-binding protein
MVLGWIHLWRKEHERDLDLGFAEIVKHYYFPGWHQPSTLADLMINLERRRELDATRQAQIEAARAATMRDSIAESEALQFKALQEVQAKGVQLHRWPPEMLAAFEAAWQEVAAGEAAAHPDFKCAWDSLQNLPRRVQDLEAPRPARLRLRQVAAGSRVRCHVRT